MLEFHNVPPVDGEESLARFIVHSSHVRRSNCSVKPDAFMPHPRVELSVTRHRSASDEDLWREGSRVALIRGMVLQGRADVLASAFLDQGLIVEARPILENPNHADALGWPKEKAAQKILATEIANRSNLVLKSS